MASDNQAIILQLSADVRGMQKAIDRANGIVESGAKSWERSAKSGAAGVERALGNIRLPNRLRRELNDFGRDLGRGLQDASRTAQIALAGISAYAIKLAADAAEIDSAFDVAFKDASKSAREFSNVLSKRVGRDAVETREAMTRLQLVLTGTGVAAEQATQIVKTLAEVGIDAGSLFNTSDAEAFQKIISGLSGEAEPLKAFGVVINEAAVKAELLRLGFKGTASEASESAKAVARANLIIKGLAVAQGDAVRTADSAANTTRRMRAEFNAAARDLGTQLLPAFTAAAKSATNLLKAFSDLPSGVQVGSLAILAFIAAGGPIAGLIANLSRVIKLARDTRAAIAGIAAANVAAGASGAAGAAAGAGAGAAAAASVPVVGTVAAGGALIASGLRYNRTVKEVEKASDDAIAAAVRSARAQIQATGDSKAGVPRVKKLTGDLAVLMAEQARRQATPAASAGSPTEALATVVGGFKLSPTQQTGTGKKSGGGSSKADKANRDAERAAEEALRQQERADGLIARANEDILRAMSGRAETAEDRYKAEIDALDAEREVRAQELAYSVKQGELTAAQAERVALAEEAARIARRLNAETERDAQTAEDRGALRQAELDGQEAAAQLQLQLARTAQQRRDAEFTLLDLADQRAQADLDVIAATKGVASVEYQIAQQRLNDLRAARPGQEAVVRRDTQGSFANYRDSIKDLDVAFEDIATDGVSNLIDGLAEAGAGMRSFKSVLVQTIQQMAVEANRALLQNLFKGMGGGGGFLKSLFKIGGSLAGSAFGAPTGGMNIIGADGGFIPFANGTNSAPGGLSLVGERGPELLNIPKGAQVIPNDILRSMAASRSSSSSYDNRMNMVVHVTPSGAMTGADARRTGMQIASAAQQRMALSRKRGING